MQRVAFLGPEGTFTSEAARRAVPDAAAREALATIPDVVDAVRSGRVPLGVVPIENSIEGSVNLTLDELAFGPPGALVRAEVTVPIAMHLLAPAGTDLDRVRIVRSQPHALAQCRGWLARHLPDVELEASTSTAEAAREVAAGDGSVAALGPALAAERYALTLLARDVHDHTGNTTRFVVLGRTMAAPTGADKTSLVVFFGEDRPGQLRRVLDEFDLRGVNLTKIESRPTKQSLGEYAILIDCAGHVTEARLGEALRSVHRHADQLRVLGSYPRADGAPSRPRAGDAEAAYERASRWYTEILRLVDEPA